MLEDRRRALRDDERRFQPGSLRRRAAGRGYRETRLHVGAGGVQVATQGAAAVIEKKINVPDSWLRGFLQVQSAATLALDSFRLARSTCTTCSATCA